MLFPNKINGPGKEALFAFFINCLSVAVMFILHIVLARVLGADQYGIYSYVMAWIYFLVMFGKMGWDMTLVRYVANYQAREAWATMSGILKFSSLTVIASSILFALLGCILASLNKTRFEPEMAFTLWIGAFAIPFVAMTFLNASVLRAMRKIMLAQIPDAFFRPLLLLALIFIASLLSIKLNSISAMILTLIAALATFGLSLYWVRQQTPDYAKRASPLYEYEEWLSSCLSFCLIASATLLMNRIDILMIGIFRNTIDAGIYAVACRTAALITLGFGAFNFIIAPMLANLYARGEIKELQRLLALATRGIVVLAVPIFAFMIVSGRFVLSLFGPEFSEGYHALVILSCGQLVSALAGPVDHLMTLTQPPRKTVKILLTCCVLNIIANAVLIPRLGLQGAAIATTTSTLAWNLLLSVAVRKQLKSKAVNP